LRLIPLDLDLAMCLFSFLGRASAIRWPTNCLNLALAMGITIKEKGLANKPPTLMVSLSNELRLLGKSVERLYSSAAATFLSLGRITRSTKLSVQFRPLGSFRIRANLFSAADLEPTFLASVSHFSTRATASAATWSRSNLCTY